MSKRNILKKRGKEAFQKQISESGGTYTTHEVSELLCITASAVQKLTEHCHLLAIPLGDKTCYPVWQFDENGVIEHFSVIMGMLNTSSPVGVVQFFLTNDLYLGQSPIDALRSGDPKQLDKVKLLAKQFYQQIAR